MEIKNNKQLSVVLYLLPFSSKGKEIKDNKYYINEQLVLTKNDSNYYRNLVRSDIKSCIDNMSVYSLFLRDDYNRALKLKSYAVRRIKNAEGKYTDKVAMETNLSEMLHLTNILIYHFDDENQFLALKCALDDPRKEEGRPVLDAVIAHAHILNNYFKEETGIRIEQTENLFDITKDKEHLSSFLRIVYKKGDQEYEYSLDGKDEYSISKEDGITFDFNNHFMRFIIQMVLFDTNYDRKLLVTQLATRSVYPFVNYDNNGLCITNKMMYLSTSFGSAILYWKDKDEDEDIWAIGNKAAISLFYNELIFDFLIALNYQIRVEKQINVIGKLSFDGKESEDYHTLINQMTEYKRNTAKYYFKNVSQLDYVNDWYRSVVKGFDSDNIDDELEIRFQYSIDYLKESLKAVNEKTNRRFSFLLRFLSFFSGVVLFILATLEASEALSKYGGGKVDITLIILIIDAIIFLGSIIGYLIFDHKVRKIKKDSAIEE